MFEKLLNKEVILNLSFDNSSYQGGHTCASYRGRITEIYDDYICMEVESKKFSKSYLNKKFITSISIIKN